MAEAAPRRPRRWFIVAAVALGVGAAFAFVEVALRFTKGPGWAAEQLGPEVPETAARWEGHTFLPFVGRRSSEYEFDFPQEAGPARVRVRNNEEGFRSLELPREKRPEDYFIVTLGESTTWGAIAPTNAETWPERLAAKLQERYPARRVRAFNFGVQNANGAYSVVSLALLGIAVQPDLVIAYHGFNETASALATSYRFDHTHYFRDLDLEHSWHGFAASLPAWLRWSYVMILLASEADESIGARRLSFYIGDGSDLITPAESEWPARFERNWMTLQSIDSIARGHGAKALFSTFQFFNGDDPLYRAVNDSLRQFFQERKLDFVDLDTAMPDFDPGLQFDGCHFTHVGRERVADVFYQRIVADRLLEQPVAAPATP